MGAVDFALHAVKKDTGKIDQARFDAFELAKEAAGSVRGVRQQKGISPREPLKLKIKGAFPKELLPVVMKLANVSDVEFREDLGGLSGVGFMVGTIEMFVLLEGLVNAEEEIAKLEAALKYQREFLDSVRKKLSNANFTAHAPEAVVAAERKKAFPQWQGLPPHWRRNTPLESSSPCLQARFRHACRRGG